ncbi:MAG: hypothetical protein WCR55_14320 [Lentisphaerota bacterium]
MIRGNKSKKLLLLLLSVFFVSCLSSFADDLASKIQNGTKIIVAFTNGKVILYDTPLRSDIIHKEDPDFTPLTAVTGIKFCNDTYLLILCVKQDDSGRTLYPLYKYDFTKYSWSELFDGVGAENNQSYLMASAAGIYILLNDNTLKQLTNTGWVTCN